MTEFDHDTAVEQLTENSFRGFVDPGWNIGDNPNGGYLLSLVTSAVAAVVPHPDPLSITTHFLRPGIAGTHCEIEVDLVRTGRTMSTVKATMRQEGKIRLEVLAAYGDLSQVVGIDSEISLLRPDIPPPGDCIPRTGDLQGIDIALVSKLDARLHPEHLVPGKSGVAQLAGWVRLNDDQTPDSRSLLLFCDCFPPSPFGRIGAVGWVPTIELTVHVRRRPAPGWIQSSFQTDDLCDGRMVESGCLWDSRGELVAQSRQIGLVRQS